MDRVTYPENILRDGRIDYDVNCVGCDYDVRGLTPEATCPECGAAIQGTIDPGRLCFDDPTWLRRTNRGIALLSYAGTAFGILVISLIPISMIGHLGRGATFHVLAAVGGLLSLICLLLSIVLVLIGLGMVTDHRIQGDGLRTGFALGGVFFGTLVFVVSAATTDLLERGALSIVLLMLAMYSIFMWLLSSRTRILASICQRLPNERLMGMTRRRATLLRISAIVTFVAMCLASIPAWENIDDALDAIALILMLITVFSAYACLSMFRVAKPYVRKGIGERK